MRNKYRTLGITLILGLALIQNVLAATPQVLSAPVMADKATSPKVSKNQDLSLIGTWDAYADIDANIAGGTYRFKPGKIVELIPNIKGARPAKGTYATDKGVLTVNLTKEGMGTSSMFYTIQPAKKGSPELLELHYTNGIKQNFQKRAITKTKGPK